MTKMHADEIHTDEALIHRLLLDQAPQWADLPVRRLASSGTDNTIFRLGDRLSLRIPRRPSAVLLLTKELDWLPHFEGLPLEVPVLRFRGSADLGLDCEFGIFAWMDGQIASPENIVDKGAAAHELATFLKALRGMSTAGAPAAGELNSRRGIALKDLTAATLPAIDILVDEIDAHRACSLWEAARAARYNDAPVWLHGDLKSDNLIAWDGKLRGVIDWGLSAVGDPAADYASAWSWVDPSARRIFHEVLNLDDEDWLRAKGWALYGAVIALSYYRGGKNDALCRQSRLTLSRLGLLL
jgi:aminoglycoside phosphotransferase (APT) family kinase protein